MISIGPQELGNSLMPQIPHHDIPDLLPLYSFLDFFDQSFSVSFLVGITSQITGGKKQSEERTALFAARVDLPC